MSNQEKNGSRMIAVVPEPTDEGGLRAPPGLSGLRKAWWWFDFIILVKLARLRFIAVLVLIGAIITQWDLLTAYYEKWTRSPDDVAAAEGDVEWFCPMHPAVIRNNGKEKCPVCFMPLSKRKKGDAHLEALPSGIVNRVQLSPYRIVLAGIQTWELDFQPVSKEIKAAGFIEFNERGQRTVSARIAGRIDKLLVNETGQMVRAGDELASIYSPDLVATVQNLLDAKRGGNTKNQESAQRRLALLGIDDAQIDEIVSANKDRTDLTIRSPISGHVIKKYVREGQYVEQGSPLYDVADLSTVWVQAQIYEDDLEFLPLDQQRPNSGQDDAIDITATTRAFPDEMFRGKLGFVYPHVDQNTRTVTVRCELDNPGHRLRPGSTATVILKVLPKNLPALVSATSSDPEQSEMLKQGQMLALPETAVIDTGAQSIVYRESAPGTFEGVRVKLGPRMTGADGASLYPVLEGLTRGERVVASGSFLVDAETRLNPAAGSVYFGGGGSKSAKASVSAVRPSTPQDEQEKLAAVLARMPVEERRIAETQRFCPILEQNRLGSMGTPVKVIIEGQLVFLCCDGCKKQALDNPKTTLATLAARMHGNSSQPAEAAAVNGGQARIQGELAEEARLMAALTKLSAGDRALASAQKFCVVLEENRLGSMGKPVKIMIEGQPVFLCCEGCKKKALANSKASLAKAAKLKAEAAKR